MKKFASLLITLLMFVATLMIVAPISLSATTVSAEEVSASGVDYSDGEIHWELKGETLTLWGHGNMKNYAKDEAPWYEYDAYKTVKHIKVGIGETDYITRIGSYAFAYFYYLESIELGEGIEIIEDYAFYYAGYYCDSPKIDLVTPSTVFYIGRYAFCYAYGLKNVYIKSEYDALPDYTKGQSYHTVMGDSYHSEYFLDYGGNIKADGVYIQYGAFYNCENMETLAIGNFKRHELKNVHIGKYAFNYCYKLKEIYFSDSLASISEDSFYECTAIYDVYYFGDRNNFPRGQIAEEDNTYLIRDDYPICKPYIDTYQHDANHHWHDIAEMPLYEDEGKLPHNFVMLVDDKYKKNDGDIYYYKSCAICGEASSETFSIADVPETKRLTTEMTTLESGWYVVDSQLDFGRTRLLIKEDVKLVLLDGCGITTSGGIYIGNNRKLTVYSESIDLSKDNNMGYIKVTGAPERCAGIGSNRWDKVKDFDEENVVGELIIYGGNIDARGGYNGAGIGSGDHANFTVIINNGRVFARGGFDGAGIGSGYDSNSTVIINGGYIEARGTEGGAGIGCGSATDFVAYTWVELNGGTIKAWGGEYAYAIGRGNSNYTKFKIYYNGNPSIETHDGTYAGLWGSTISNGSIWIIVGVSVVAVGVVVTLVIVKKKKKSAVASGDENTNEE